MDQINEHMIRKQTYITSGQNKELKKLAKVKQTTEAQVIREALEYYIREERKKTTHNPLLDLIGLGGDAPGPRDGSVNHDRYLYDRQ
jgi:hypothetical protein